MGNAVYTDQLICYDTIEACRASCSSECVFTDKCNGAANKYLCVPVDFRWLTWLIFGCFLIVVLCCSSLVACYACRAIRASVRNQWPYSSTNPVGSSTHWVLEPSGFSVFANPLGNIGIHKCSAGFA